MDDSSQELHGLEKGVDHILIDLPLLAVIILWLSGEKATVATPLLILKLFTSFPIIIQQVVSFCIVSNPCQHFVADRKEFLLMLEGSSKVSVLISHGQKKGHSFILF